MIDIAVLGTGAMMPTSSRWLSSLLIRFGDEMMLFDVGEGVQIPWRNQGWGLKRVSMICTSHWHADHIAGLPGVLHGLANAGRDEPVTILGPKGTRAVIAGMREIVPVLPYEVISADLSNGDSWQWNDLSISVAFGQHRVPVLLYRFDLPRRPAFLADLAREHNIPQESWSVLAAGSDVIQGQTTWRSSTYLGPARAGISFGVATDTRPTESAVHLLQGVDLLVAEGTYGDDVDHDNAIVNKHMTFREAATLALAANVRKLLVTHFSPKMSEPAAWLTNATDVFPETEIATPGQTITLKYPD